MSLSQQLPVAENRNPLVMATFTANKATKSKAKRRILFYGHCQSFRKIPFLFTKELKSCPLDDVIAQGKDQEWTSPPFQLSGKDGYVYGRGGQPDASLSAKWLADRHDFRL